MLESLRCKKESVVAAVSWKMDAVGYQLYMHPTVLSYMQLLKIGRAHV